MLKLAQKFSVLFLIIFLLGCSDQKSLTKAKQPDFNHYTSSQPIDYLNSIRNDVGLHYFTENENLNKSALAHANYLFANKEFQASIDAHNEISSKAGFTGENAMIRALNAGFNSAKVVENISFNQIDFASSIDNLLSGIYHRFGFLNYDYNLIGYASIGEKDKKIYVYNMGNSNIENFCKRGVSDSGYGEFILGFCKNKELKTKKENFEYMQNISFSSFIKYPTKQAMATFSSEVPDPFPACKITANPVSIEFQKDSGKIIMNSFELFKSTDKLYDTYILSKDNDPNKIFSDKQFAVFSKEPFEFGETYKAVFKYSQNGENKKIEWSFDVSTPNYPYFVVTGGENLIIDPNKTYEIFFKPKDCNDKVEEFSYSTRFLTDTQVITSNANTLRFKTNGYKNGKLTIQVPGKQPINLYINNSSKDAKSLVYSKFLIAFIVVGLLVILFLIKKFYKG